MLTPQWVAAESTPDGPAGDDSALLDAGRIDRNCELEILRRSSVMRVTVRPIELAAPVPTSP